LLWTTFFILIIHLSRKLVWCFISLLTKRLHLAKSWQVTIWYLNQYIWKCSSVCPTFHKITSSLAFGPVLCWFYEYIVELFKWVCTTINPDRDNHHGSKFLPISWIQSLHISFVWSFGHSIIAWNNFFRLKVCSDLGKNPWMVYLPHQFSHQIKKRSKYHFKCLLIEKLFSLIKNSTLFLKSNYDELKTADSAH